MDLDRGLCTQQVLCKLEVSSPTPVLFGGEEEGERTAVLTEKLSGIPSSGKWLLSHTLLRLVCLSRQITFTDVMGFNGLKQSVSSFLPPTAPLLQKNFFFLTRRLSLLSDDSPCFIECLSCAKCLPDLSHFTTITNCSIYPLTTQRNLYNCYPYSTVKKPKCRVAKKQVQGSGVISNKRES